MAHGLELAATLAGVDVVFGEPVCNHLFSQKMMAKMGFVTRALEVDLMLASTYTNDASATGRVAAFLDFKTYRPKPHTVYLPGSYAEVLRFFYDDLYDERGFCVSVDAIPATAATDMRFEVFDFVGVARIAVHVAGADFSKQMDLLEKKLHEKGVVAIQVCLDLSCPWLGAATEILRNRGFFLGGVLPRWFDTDGLLMQKIRKVPDWKGIGVYTDRAAKILEKVRTDWERADKEEFSGN